MRGGAWQRNYTRDDDLGNKDVAKARLLLKWTPVDKLKVDVNLNGWVDHSETQAGQLLEVVLNKPAYASKVPNVVAAPVSPDDPQAANWLAGEHPRDDESYYQGSVRAEYLLSDSLTLTYLGAYEKYSEHDQQLPTGINYSFGLYPTGSVSSDYQELRLNGQLLEGKVDWLLGGAYSDNIADENQLETTSGSTSSYALTGYGAQLHEPAVLPFTALRNISSDDAKSGAAFTNVEYRPIDPVSMHAGARFTRTDIAHDGCTEDYDGNYAAGITQLETVLTKGVGVVPVSPGGCATFGPSLRPGYIEQSLNQNNVSWRGGGDWTVFDKTLLYTSVSRGYKSGSFPTLAATTFEQMRPVPQEALLAYEVGLKSTVASGRGQLNLDYFHYDYTDKQVEGRVPDPEGIFGLLNTLVNIPKSVEDGVELSARYEIVKGLRASFEGTYIQSAITGDFFSYTPYVTKLANFAGEPLPNTPKWSTNLGLQYGWDVNATLSAFAGGSWRYQTIAQGLLGSAVSIQQGYPSTFINPHGIADLRAGVQSKDGHWRLELFGNNVTNTYYWTQATRVGDSVVRFTGLPATYGMTLAYTY